MSPYLLTFSVPDRNTLWNRTEVDLPVEDVSKDSTSDVLFSDVLFPDWNEVVSELSGNSSYQYKECYRITDTVVKLTFVFLCTVFFTILTRSHKRYRLGGFCTTCSLQDTCWEIDVSKCIWHQRALLSPDPPRPPPPRSRMYTGESVLGTQPDRRWPTPRDCHVCTRVYRSPLLVHLCTQVYRFSEPYLTDVDQLRETDVSKCVWQEVWWSLGNVYYEGHQIEDLHMSVGVMKD